MSLFHICAMIKDVSSQFVSFVKHRTVNTSGFVLKGTTLFSTEGNVMLRFVTEKLECPQLSRIIVGNVNVCTIITVSNQNTFRYLTRSKNILTIYAPMIYTAPCEMF